MAELNLEMMIIAGYGEFFDITVLRYNSESSEASNSEWLGFVNAIKKFIKKQSSFL